MKITQTRLKQIIQEELAAVQEGDKVKRARRQCAAAGGNWDAKIVSKRVTDPKTGAEVSGITQACKDDKGNVITTDIVAVKENVNSQEPRYVDMDEVGEILKAKFESDVWDLRSKGEEGNVKEVAAKLLLDYVTGHINRLEKGHLEESELEEGAGEVYCKDRRAPGGFRRQPPCPPGYDQQQIADKRGPAGGVEQSDRYRSGHKPSIWE